MTLSPTPHEERTLDQVTEDAVTRAARQFRAIIEAGKPRLSFASIAAAVDRDPTIVEQWAKGSKPLPVWALFHPFVPRSVRAALIAALASSLQTHISHTTPEQSTAKLLRLMGDLLAKASAMFADGVIDECEQIALRPLVEALYQACADWLAQHGHSTATNKGPNEDK